MKKLIYCNDCNRNACNSCSKQIVVDETTVCDTCGAALENQALSDRITLIVGDTDYDFCSLVCIFKFIAAENAKEKQ